MRKQITILIKKQLADSNRSFIEIADLLRFEHPEYLHVFFKRETQMTLQEYRQNYSQIRKL